MSMDSPRSEQIGAGGRRRIISDRPLFWMPVRSDDVGSVYGTTFPETDDARWLCGQADALEKLRSTLPEDVMLRNRNCLTAAVYVEAARRSLAIAVDSLRWTAMIEPDPLAELRGIDPLLAEWLN